MVVTAESKRVPEGMLQEQLIAPDERGRGEEGGQGGRGVEMEGGVEGMWEGGRSKHEVGSYLPMNSCKPMMPKTKKTHASSSTTSRRRGMAAIKVLTSSRIPG